MNLHAQGEASSSFHDQREEELELPVMSDLKTMRPRMSSLGWTAASSIVWCAMPMQAESRERSQV